VKLGTTEKAALKVEVPWFAVIVCGPAGAVGTV